MLKLIITEDKQGLVWGNLVKTKNTELVCFKGELRKSLQKKGGRYEYWENIIM